MGLCMTLYRCGFLSLLFWEDKLLAFAAMNLMCGFVEKGGQN